MNILNKLKLHFKKIKNYNIEYIFKTDKNRFNNFSILFNKNILIDFSKNILNKYTINLLLKLFNKFNYLNFLEKNNLNYNKIFYIDVFLLEKITNFYKNKFCKFNYIIENIVNISNLEYKYEFDFLSKSLKEYKINNYKFYYFSYLNVKNINIINNLNLKKTFFIISCNEYKDLKLIEIINFLKIKINKNINNFFKYINNNIILISSDIKKREININTNNFIEINNYLNINTNSIYYISMVLIIYLGYINFNDFINGILNINNNFLCEKKIYNNISIILSLIDIWYLIFFKYNINLIFTDFCLDNFINYYMSLQIFYENINFYKNIVLGSSDIYIQNFLYKIMFNNKNINCEFIFFCNNKNFLFKYNHNDFISDTFYKSKSIFFKNKNINNYLSNENIIPNNFILFNKLNPNNLGILIYIYKYRIFIKNNIINNINNEKLIFNNLSIIDILDLKYEKQEVNYDISTNELINFYKKNRYL